MGDFLSFLFFFFEVGTYFSVTLKKREKIMKLLLFEDRDSKSLHLLPWRSVFSAPDRLGEEKR